MTLAVPDQLAVATALAADAQPSKPVLSVSVIRVKPGHFEEFMALQTAHLERIRGTVAGVRGGRLFKSAEKNTVLMLSAFETAEDGARFRQDPRFREHLDLAGAMIESSEALPLELAYEIGVI
ncbi:antibiotic biosynthesis monooxygenase [Caulobacter sp. 1776]|uniref:putative quinol monooxygenase n=1 Tax=Caulobacter sp. 1776 TaxID=3156420 RepID=UPI003398FAA0